MEVNDHTVDQLKLMSGQLKSSMGDLERFYNERPPICFTTEECEKLRVKRNETFHRLVGWQSYGARELLAVVTRILEQTKSEKK